MIPRGPIGTISMMSGVLVLTDGPKLRGAARILSVPKDSFEVRANFIKEGSSYFLNQVIICNGLQVPSAPEEPYEIVVDSGEYLVVDGEFAEAIDLLQRLQTECRDVLAHLQTSTVPWQFLIDKFGLSRGLVVRPPWGDGAYIAKVRREGTYFEIRCDVFNSR